jgi:hypothetical protein
MVSGCGNTVIALPGWHTSYRAPVAALSADTRYHMYVGRNGRELPAGRSCMPGRAWSVSPVRDHRASLILWAPNGGILSAIVIVG